MNEVKNITAIDQTSEIVADNIRTVERGNTKLTEMPYALDMIAGIHFSSYAGVLVLNNYAISN